MNKDTLVSIANNLTTKYKSKGHGGYNIYQDDKICISYDTYYPNLQVNVCVDGKWELAALYSGHGHTIEFHHGAWCGYVDDVLAPKAEAARIEKEQVKKRRQEDAARAKSKPLNDAHVFS